MTSRGLDVHAVSAPGELLDQFEAREPVTVHPVPMTRAITPFRDLSAVRQIAKVIKSIRPQIVHAHTPKGGLLGTMAAAIAKVPIRIYHIRGFPFMTARGPKRRLLRWTEWAACRMATQVLCISPSLREVAIAEGICPAEKIKVLAHGSGNGIDARGRFNAARRSSIERQQVRDELGIAKDALVLGFVGRIARDKGIAELAASWQSIREEFPNAELVLVGPLEENDPVPGPVIEQLRRDARVHFVGMVGDAARYYTAFDLCVLPTYREGLGMVLLEAAAMGLPTVATRIPGCVDAVQDGVTGTLVPPRDAAALAGAIRRYLADPRLRERHGRAGRARVVRDFQHEVVWEALYDEYARLLHEQGRELREMRRAA